MLSVKSLSTQKTIVKDDDIHLTQYTETRPQNNLYKGISPALLHYNINVAYFAGYIHMNACNIVARNTVLMTLPISPSGSEAFIYGFYSGTNSVIPFFINDKGHLLANTSFDVAQDSFIDLVGAFPILSGGGVTLKGLLSKIKHFFHREEVLA